MLLKLGARCTGARKAIASKENAIDLHYAIQRRQRSHVIVVGVRDDKGIQTGYMMPRQRLTEQGVLITCVHQHRMPAATDKNSIALPNIERDDLASPIRNRRFQQGEHDRADDSGN